MKPVREREIGRERENASERVREVERVRVRVYYILLLATRLNWAFIGPVH